MANEINKELKVIGGTRLGIVLSYESTKELKVIGGESVRIVLANESTKRIKGFWLCNAGNSIGK